MAVLLFLLFAFSCAEKWSGSVLREGDGLWFLGKFCFEIDPTDVVGSIDITLNTATPDQWPNSEILLFLDDDNGWPAVWNKGLTCDEWISHSVDAGRRTVIWNNGNFHVLINDITEHTRPHFWFVALSTCTPEIGRAVQQECRDRSRMPSSA
eukprot:TRINITY_DN20495_c0_g1_i5.p1 TRINITY_DN20495_c0_g1~~TRINITY_DN20495_c0_g1_i5.p1  ORF type:complete len:152 (-),score=18.01 TRINITY_DN20495_c0_g1_i5:10-465(-)